MHDWGPLNLQWLAMVLRIGGTDFLHCWVANYIRLERAESLITIYGGLFRAFTNFRVFTNFRAMLPVNNSLVCLIGLLLLGFATHYRES